MKKSVNSKIYDTDYYLHDGYNGKIENFIASLDNPSYRMKKEVDLANLTEGNRVLDIGCGQGHIVYACAKKGCIVDGYDYSKDAIALAQQAKKNLPQALQKNVTLTNGDVKNIAEDKHYDVIFMLDVVEHLYDWELTELFAKIEKLLHPEHGRLIIHTSPNKWFIDIIFPLKRILSFPKTLLRGKKIYYERNKYFYDREMHVNEQTPFSLTKHLRKFNAKVWCEDGSSNVLSILTKKVCGSDIWAVAKIRA